MSFSPNQIFVGRLNLGTTTSAQYFAPTSPSEGINTTQGEMTVPWCVAGTFGNVYAKLTAAPGGSATRTITIEKNGSTQLTLSFTSSDTVIINTGTFSIADGDTLAAKAVGTGTIASANLLFVIEFSPTTAFQQGYAQGDTTFGGTGVNYQGFYSGKGVETSQNSVTQTVGQDCTVTKLSVKINSAPGAGVTMTWSLVKNGTNQDGSGGSVDTRVTISGAAQTANSGTFSLSLSAGDNIAIREDQSTVQKRVQIGVRLVATAAGFCLASDRPTTATSGHFINPTGVDTSGTLWSNATESNVDCITGVSRIVASKLMCRVSSATGSGNTWTVVQRRAQTTDVKTLTIANADGTNAVTVTGNDVYQGATSIALKITRNAAADVTVQTTIFATVMLSGGGASKGSGHGKKTGGGAVHTFGPQGAAVIQVGNPNLDILN